MILPEAQHKALAVFGPKGRAFEWDSNYYVGFDLGPVTMIIGVSDKSWEQAFNGVEGWVKRGRQSKGN